MVKTRSWQHHHMIRVVNQAVLAASEGIPNRGGHVIGEIVIDRGLLLQSHKSSGRRGRGTVVLTAAFVIAVAIWPAFLCLECVEPDNSAPLLRVQDAELTYQISIEDGECVARNATSGVIQIADFNATLVIQWAIDNIPVGGGSLLFLPGEYVLNYSGRSQNPACGYSLIISEQDPAIHLVGMPGANFTRGQNLPFNTALLLVRGKSYDARLSPTTVEDIGFDGSNSSQPVWSDYADLTVVYASNVTIEACSFCDSPFRSCQILRQLTGFAVLNSTFNQDTSRGVSLRVESHFGLIAGNTFIGNDSLVISSVSINPNDDTQTPAEYVSVVNNTFIHGGRQLVMSGASNCTIHGNIFRDLLNPTGVSFTLNLYDATFRNWPSIYNKIDNNTFLNIPNAIAIAGSVALSVGSFHNDICDNMIIAGPDVVGVRGIFEVQYADFNLIARNGFGGRWSVSTVSVIGANTIVVDNYIIDEIPEIPHLALPVAATMATVWLVLASRPKPWFGRRW